MRVLVLLVAVNYCSAQLVLPYTAPWVLPSAKLTTTADSDGTVAIHTPYIGHPLASPYLHPNIYTNLDEESKTVAINTPYIGHPYLHPNTYSHPLASPYLHPNTYTHPLATPYLHPYGYPINTDGALKATEFPFVYEAVKSEEPASPAVEEEAAPAVEEARRRRRDVQAVRVPLPYVHAIPAIAKKTIETKQYETAEAATPADTTKIELTTREHEITVPAVRYVQPVVKYQPLTYTAISPAVLPYNHHILPPYSAYSSYPYPLLHSTPLIKLKED